MGAIIMKSAVSLRTLPAATEVRFPGAFAWEAVSSSVITAALGADHGSWAVWRSRRLTPSPLPEAWFRRTIGGPLFYRVDTILTWLTARRGEEFTTLDAWRLCLQRDLGEGELTPERVRGLVRSYAQAGRRHAPFTAAGFEAYLASLAQA